MAEPVIAYRKLGRGRPLLCLAGGPGAEPAYLENLGGLDAGFELIIPDMPGTGETPPPESVEGYSFEAIARDVETLRINLALDRLALLTHSAACTTALVYAADHPDVLEALLLVAPSRVLYDEVEDDTGTILDRRRDEPWYSSVVSARADLEAGADPAEVPDLLRALAPSSYARWTDRERTHAAAMEPADWEASRHFWRHTVDGTDLRNRLGRVGVPVLVVTGDLDAAVGVNAGAAWATSFPNGRHVSMAGVAHHPWVDDPEGFGAIVREFL